MLNLILGKSKSGKSKYIYDKIDEALKNRQKVILFVPSQLRVLTEQKYIKYQKKQGIIDINITTISEFVAQNLKEMNIYYDQNYITKLDKKLILAKIVLQNSNMFKVFSTVSHKIGFLDTLNIYMDIFKKENIDISKFKIIDKSKKKIQENKYNGNDDNNEDDKNRETTLLNLKLDEISRVYEKYMEQTKDKFVDQVDQMQLFSQIILSSKNNLKGYKIFFDGYNNFTESEYMYISALLSKNIDLTFAINSDITASDDVITKIAQQDIFLESDLTFKKLKEISNKLNIKTNIEYMQSNFLNSKDDIKYLSQNIFKVEQLPLVKAENIQIMLKSNMYEEIQNIALDISKKVKNDSYRYSDFAIYSSNIKTYQPVIFQIFDSYNIPVYVNQKISLGSNSLCIYISKLLSIVIGDFNLENLFEILKLGLNDISDNDICLLENYVLEFNIKRYKFNEKFTLNNNGFNGVAYELDKLNNIRQKVVEIFKNITSYSKSRLEVSQIVAAIYEHLMDNNVIQNYQNQVNMLEKLNTSETIYLADIKKQVWDNISDIFDSMSKIYKDEKISLNEFLDIFNYLIKDVYLKTIPATLDQVNVLDINVDKADIKKCIYVVGVNENSLPKKIEQDNFFSDEELKKIKEDTEFELKKSYISKYNMQLFNIYEMINNVTDKIYFSIPVSDISGKTLRISPLINDIKKVVDISVIGDIAQDEQIDFEHIYSNSKLFEYMVSKLNEIYDDKKEGIKDEIKKDEKLKDKLYQVIGIYKYIYSKQNRFSNLLKYIKDDSNLNKQSIDKLYGEKFTTSVSKLEEFKACPFSYFMDYGLTLKPRKIYSITSMDIGTFMHSVLEQFSEFLYTNNIVWQSLLLQEENTKTWQDKLEEIISNELDKNFLKHGESIKFNLLKQKLTTTMNKVVMTIARSFNQSEFKPYGYEIEFRNGKLFAPIHVKLNEQQDMYLVGKIDRVDMLKYEDKIYARVVDYKSSDRILNLDDVKEGLSLQLITYLYAVSKNLEQIQQMQVVPAGAVYFNLSDKLLNIHIDEKNSETIEAKISAALKMKGIYLKDVKILKEMDNKFGTSQSLIDVTNYAINNQNSKKALNEKDYIELCNNMKDTLKDIGQEVVKGVVKIAPNKKKKLCEYCNFSSICRKNMPL